MDPNETLRRLRELLDPEDMDKREAGLTPEEADEAAGLFSALDQWIGRGGFLPDAWNMLKDPS